MRVIKEFEMPSGILVVRIANESAANDEFVYIPENDSFRKEVASSSDKEFIVLIDDNRMLKGIYQRYHKENEPCNGLEAPSKVSMWAKVYPK